MSFGPDGLRPNVSSGICHESALSEDQLTTDLQRARRARILDAALDAAGTGGYDLVHVRDIAIRARVSIATLYHYFPSKVHVLVWALKRELARFDDYLSDDYLSKDLSEITDPFARLRIVVWRLIDAMEESARVAEALTHAYVASNVVATVEAEMIRVQTSEMFVHVMSDGIAPDVHRHAAELLTDVWTSEVLRLVQGRRTYAEMRRRLSTVIDLIARAPKDDSGS
jgi:AcrR family transcriptional regulator